MLVLSLVLPMVWVPREVSACSCQRFSPPDLEMNGSTAVFEGRVLEVRPPERPSPTITRLMGLFAPQIADQQIPGWLYNGVRFDVNRAWKGVDHQTVTIYTMPNVGACGNHFTVGNDYVIYAYKAPGEYSYLMTSMCTNTAPVSRAAEDLAYLDTLPPLPLSPTPNNPAGLPFELLLGMGGLLLLGMGGLAVVGYGWVKREKQ